MLIVLSGAESNSGIKFIPRLARFNPHSKSQIIKTSKILRVLMSSGKRKSNLFYIAKQYSQNLK